MKKRRRVAFSGVVDSSGIEPGCESGQAVQLQRKKPKRTDFVTFDRVATFATGNFSVQETIKKTFEYRAQVAETPTCANGTSNTEKVKVKKKE